MEREKVKYTEEAKKEREPETLFPSSCLCRGDLTRTDDPLHPMQ